MSTVNQADNEITFVTNSSAETQAVAARLADHLEAGDLLLLRGDLGAGKTTFAQGIAAGLGIHQPVTSPTFTLLQELKGGGVPLYHFDLYRLAGPAEVFDLGFFDYLEQGGVVVVEWPERLGDSLPESWIDVELTITGEESRQVAISGHGKKHDSLAAALGGGS
jgi:tRNA threonylcarbamoyladenosine biosynthesis protein TsaE